ncbi:MAG: hypothetical protein GY699_23180 [Desulfobacteraceae bacterium]|nr:hypothetical protein [Desulfobacteraceae bacterium]
MIEDAGSVLNLRKYYYCGPWINFFEREKGTPTCLNNGRQQSIGRKDEYNGHHRGRRPEHVFKGVARELERAHSLLDKQQATGLPGKENPGVQGDGSTPLNKTINQYLRIIETQTS